MAGTRIGMNGYVQFFFDSRVNNVIIYSGTNKTYVLIFKNEILFRILVHRSPGP